MWKTHSKWISISFNREKKERETENSCFSLFSLDTWMMGKAIITLIFQLKAFCIYLFPFLGKDTWYNNIKCVTCQCFVVFLLFATIISHKYSISSGMANLKMVFSYCRTENEFSIDNIMYHHKINRSTSLKSKCEMQIKYQWSESRIIGQKHVYIPIQNWNLCWFVFEFRWQHVDMNNTYVTNRLKG